MDKFTDKNGNLGLADKQKKHFGGNPKQGQITSLFTKSKPEQTTKF